MTYEVRPARLRPSVSVTLKILTTIAIVVGFSLAGLGLRGVLPTRNDASTLSDYRPACGSHWLHLCGANVTGIADGKDGDLITIDNLCQTPTTLYNENVESEPLHRMRLPLDSSFAIGESIAVVLRYAGPLKRWELVDYSTDYSMPRIAP